MIHDDIQTLTEKEVATALRCSTAALRRMRREGRGPQFTRVGRLVRYPADWLRDYINQQRGDRKQENGFAQLLEEHGGRRVER